jgi:ATP-binding cassette subfamily F protein 3
MIILRNISLRRGSKILLEPADLTIQPGQRIALTGANGCGKSSLFAMLLGELEADSGHIDGLDALRIACMAQEVAATDQTALEYLIGGDARVAKLRQSIAQAEQAEDFKLAAALHSQLEELNGYDIERRAELMLLGLGFGNGESSHPVRDFSGGWRIRLNLGRALMAPSDLLLLDEPTNHLDLDATLWLQQWLQAYRGTLILISHDREFIDACCQQILHIEHMTISSYRGNYSSFETQRAEQLANQQASYEKQQRRVAEIDAFVQRFRYKATKAKQAQSRLKELERMQTIAPAHVDSPFSFKFPAPERASDPLLQLEKAVLGYGDTAVLSGVELQLRPGSRVGLLGRNGAGKSTLLKTLTGELPLLGGLRISGDHCKVGYFDQHQLESLDLDASAAQHLQRLRPDIREQEILDFLGGFNFHGDAATKIIAPFSGGEKARLALAITAWQRPALLIMDEPTNHLDMEMRLALTLALQDFAGAVVLVTHDRHLLGNTVDELLLVHDGLVEDYQDDVHAYEQWVLSQPASDRGTSAKPIDGSRKEQRQLAAQIREQTRPLKKELNSIEKQMTKVESRLAELEMQLTDNGLYEATRKKELDTLLREQGALRTQSTEQEEQWLHLQEQLETLEASLTGE